MRCTGMFTPKFETVRTLLKMKVFTFSILKCFLFTVGISMITHLVFRMALSVMNSVNIRVTRNVREAVNTPKIFPCDDKSPQRSYTLRGNRYHVLHNYLIAEKSFRCDQSITFTTHGEYRYLDNLIPIVERWRGPVSMSVYCPGDDFSEALRRIQYLRMCKSPLVKELVTFHLIFDVDHFPKMVIPQNPAKHLFPVNCAEPPKTNKSILSFKQRMKLFYPVNIARNVARENSMTRYLYPSDVELYPSNLIPEFLEMIRGNDPVLRNSSRKVFVLPIFELHESVRELPTTKQELVKLIDSNLAITFHKHTCSECHTVPKAEEWKNAEVQPGMRTFHVAKRTGAFKYWEPIYIGTNDEPVYDERLHYEGRRDKMPQMYALCLLDYDFHILDNAFLVHRPGIKRKVNEGMQPVGMEEQRRLIHQTIVPELELLYGNGSHHHGCVVP